MPDGEGVPLDTWDEVSGHYDRQRWLERSAISTAVGLLHPQPDERVLDLATGTGQVLRQLAALARPPRQVIGVDQSAGMLSRVPALPAHWSTRQADARDLPFTDAHFDVAVASYLLHLLNSEDLAVVLAELRRVLRSGGRLATCTPATRQLDRRGRSRAASTVSQSGTRDATAASAHSTSGPRSKPPASRSPRHGGTSGGTPRSACWHGHPAERPGGPAGRTSTPPQNAMRPFTRRASGDGRRYPQAAPCAREPSTSTSQ